MKRVDTALHQAGYKRHHMGLFTKFILLIIIALVVLWFTNRQVVLDLWNWILSLLGK